MAVASARPRAPSQADKQQDALGRVRILLEAGGIHFSLHRNIP
jgi:hypothetical protein